MGVGRCGTSVLHGTTPHPIPPPQGGRESMRLPFVNLAPVMRTLPTSPQAGEVGGRSRPIDEREQRLLVGLACNFNRSGARRRKRPGNLGG